MINRFGNSPIIHIILSLILLAVFGFMSGCNALLPDEAPASPTATITPTETPTPTIDWFPATATPTLIPFASATPQPTVPDQRDGVTRILVNDRFTDESLWVTTQSNSGNIAFGLQNLTLAVARENASLFSLSEHALPANFYLEITLLTSLCQSADQIGVIFWHQAPGDFYRLLLNCAGQYRLEVIQGGQTIVVYDWDSATQMKLGIPASNRLGIWVYQGEFQLYINDTHQFTHRIAQNRDGGLGVFARTITGTAMTVKFSDLQIYQVEGE